jgi:predicted ATPase
LRVVRDSPAASASPTAHGGSLLERERELASLDALIRDAGAGQAGLALVEGPAGIGKTRLVAEARRRAASVGTRVLSARGGEVEREYAFGVVRQLFEPTLAEEKTRTGALAGAAESARSVFGLTSRAVDETLDDPSFASLHGLYWLTVNLSAEGPLLLAVDDLHWCDRPSLRFLTYLVRRLEGLAVLVVCSLRPAQPGEDPALVAEIAGDPLTVTLHPRPLSELAVGDLVRERLGQGSDAAFSTACHAASGGNPLLLHELLKTLDGEGARPTPLTSGWSPTSARVPHRGPSSCGSRVSPRRP